MASLEDLLNQQILSPEQRQAKVESAVANAMPENLRRYGQLAQQQNESTFGKGLGLSTYNAYMNALNSMNQSEAAGQIRQNAENAVTQAQNAAIGNAASYATAEKNRAAQQQMAANQNTVQRQLMKQHGAQQTSGQIFQGLGGLAGGAIGGGARMFQPEIKGGLQSLYGKAFGQPASPTTEQAPNIGGGAEVPGGTGAAGDMNAANSSAYTPPSFDFSGGGGAPSMPSYGGSAAYDMPSYTSGSPDLYDLLGGWNLGQNGDNAGGWF